MKTRIAAWIAAIFMGAAFVAMPTIDAQDQYLQTAQTETAAERVQDLDGLEEVDGEQSIIKIII